MVKPLSFKGDKKPKKRKRAASPSDGPSTKSHPDEPLSKALVTSTDAAEASAEDDSWVTAEAVGDIVGPVIMVLPTDPPSCLACDALGKVFTVEVENIVEKDPRTAEPHDVRQAWIANRVAGTESFSFKGHHGCYLSCDKFGILSSTREAISPEESFTCIPVPDNPSTFALQNAREKFITVNESKPGAAPEVRGDSEDINFSSTLRVRMQARFKPRLKANKAEKAREKISRKELEDMVGRRLEDTEVKMLKKARREGNFHEKMLDVKVKGKHDKFA